MTQIPPPQLDYAPGRSLVMRIGRRRLICLTIMVAIALAAIMLTDPVVRRITRWNAERRFLSLQRQAMSYVAPADRIVYEEDPASAAALLAGDSRYETNPFELPKSFGKEFTWPWQPPARFIEPFWSQYADGVEPGRMRIRSVRHSCMSDRAHPVSDGWLA